MARVQRDKEAPISRGTDLDINQALETISPRDRVPLGQGQLPGSTQFVSHQLAAFLSVGERVTWPAAGLRVVSPGASASFTHLVLGS